MEMLTTKKQLVVVESNKDKDFYTNRCDGLPRDGVLRSLDRQIDALAYDLYLPAPRLRQAGALTPGEIKIVEGVTA
jgi:hypothetical protein